MNTVKDLIVIILLVLLIIFNLPYNKEPQIIVKTKTDTVTIIKDTTIWKDKLIYLKDTIRMPGKIDTHYVIGDYYTRKFYSDSISGENYKIKVNDTVSLNKIVGRSYYINIKEKIIKDSIFIESKTFKPSLYIGPNYNINTQTIGFEATYNLQALNIKAGYNKGFQIGVGFRLK